MRAAKLKERPGFSLMKQTDIQNLYYMQMPRWLFLQAFGVSFLGAPAAIASFARRPRFSIQSAAKKVVTVVKRIYPISPRSFSP